MNIGAGLLPSCCNPCQTAGKLVLALLERPRTPSAQPPPHPPLQEFGQRHYWSVEVGPLTLIGLSTVRFRSNPWSAHEVCVGMCGRVWAG